MRAQIEYLMDRLRLEARIRRTITSIPGDFKSLIASDLLSVVPLTRVKPLQEDEECI